MMPNAQDKMVAFFLIGLLGWLLVVLAFSRGFLKLFSVLFCLVLPIKHRNNISVL